MPPTFITNLSFSATFIVENKFYKTHSSSVVILTKTKILGITSGWNKNILLKLFPIILGLIYLEIKIIN